MGRALTDGEIVVEAVGLTKEFRKFRSRPGLAGAFADLFARRYQVVRAVDQVDLVVRRGEMVGYLGPNGAGKSTTIRLLAGILVPTSGLLRVNGMVPWRERERFARTIGVVFGQRSQLWYDLAVRESFRLLQRIYRVPEEDFRRQYGFLAEALDLDPLLEVPVRHLSLGQRMRCELAAALLHDPPLLFLDEPTIGLDVVAKDKIRGFILEMNRNGVTFILTTHDLGDVEHLAKRVIVINHGEIVFDDSMAGLKRHLGARRMVHLTTEAPLPELDNTAGVTVTERVSPYEVFLELDVSALELNQFIKALQETCVIRDLSIQEPPIESLIKEIYRKGA